MAWPLAILDRQLFRKEDLSIAVTLTGDIFSRYRPPWRQLQHIVDNLIYCIISLTFPAAISKEFPRTQCSPIWTLPSISVVACQSRMKWKGKLWKIPSCKWKTMCTHSVFLPSISLRFGSSPCRRWKSKSGLTFGDELLGAKGGTEL